MMREMRTVLAGFGGQGILFAGKVIASAGLVENRELSWLPSYGPEMRGGTASCSVTLSDNPIGSPLVADPNALIVMNQPSYDKFIDTVVPGGFAVVDSTLVLAQKQDLPCTVAALSATEMAEKEGLKGLANIVMLGKLWALTQFCARETLDAAIDHVVPAKKQAMLKLNKKALELGIQS